MSDAFPREKVFWILIHQMCRTLYPRIDLSKDLTSMALCQPKNHMVRLLWFSVFRTRPLSACRMLWRNSHVGREIRRWSQNVWKFDGIYGIAAHAVYGWRLRKNNMRYRKLTRVYSYWIRLFRSVAGLCFLHVYWLPESVWTLTCEWCLVLMSHSTRLGMVFWLVCNAILRPRIGGHFCSYSWKHYTLVMRTEGFWSYIGRCNLCRRMSIWYKYFV